MASRRFAIDLNFASAATYTGPRVALVGDAAHTIHPMAGQGLNLGIGDVMSLAAVLDEGAKSGLDLGDPGLLSRYDKERRPVNLRMQGGLDVLHHLFGSTPTPMLWARNTGMAALNAVPPLKSVVTKYAMGL